MADLHCSFTMEQIPVVVIRLCKVESLEEDCYERSSFYRHLTPHECSVLKEWDCERSLNIK